jgi:hypothetical protein
MISLFCLMLQFNFLSDNYQKLEIRKMNLAINQAPCTMHHAPCMHHAPSTMHHAPCTMHHAPCMHQAPFGINFEAIIKIVPMTRFIFVGLLFAFMAIPADAQDIIESERQMSLGMQNSFSIVLPEADEITVSKTWQDYIKRYKGKTKLLTYSSEIFSDNATAPLINNNPVDIYAHAYDRGGGKVELQVWFFLGGVWLNSKNHLAGSEAARQLIREYAQFLGQELMAIQLDLTEEQMKEQKKQLVKESKERQELEQRIAKLEEELKQNKLALKNIEERDTMLERIQNQESQVEQLRAELEQAKD